MGLQSQLNDASSESLPFILLAILATFFTHLRSLLPSTATDTALSLPFADSNLEDDEDNDNDNDKCVFCLCGLRQGYRTRKLACQHVFHTDCLDGWIGQMKFSCPLCRSPLPVDYWRVDRLHQRVVSHLPAWFAVR